MSSLTLQTESNSYIAFHLSFDPALHGTSTSLELPILYPSGIAVSESTLLNFIVVALVSVTP